MSFGRMLGVRLSEEQSRLLSQVTEATGKTASDLVRGTLMAHVRKVADELDAADTAAAEKLSADELTICKKLGVRPSGYLSAKH